MKKDKANKYIKLVRKIEKKANIRIITCEGEILFSLKATRLSTGELAQISNSSNTSFHNTLRRLVEMGVVIQSKGKEDSRQTINELSDSICAILDESNIFNIDPQKYIDNSNEKQRRKVS